MGKAEWVAVSIAPLMTIGFLVFSVYWCFIRENFAKHRIHKLIQKECINGNQIAILMKRRGFYTYDWEDEELIKEAINGNESAMKALEIEVKR